MKNKNRVFVFTICIALVSAVTLTSCATKNSGSTTAQTDEYSAVQEATITTRTVTFPAMYFQDKTEEEVRANLESNGGTDVTVNENGDYTVTMPIDKYNEIVDGMHASVKEALDAIPNSEDYPSVTAITYDDAFSQVALTSSSASLGLNEMFVTWAVGLQANIYQQIAGQPVNCQVSVLGPDGTEIQSGTFPDDFENAGTSAQ